jgi:hypothetical protein
LGSSAAIVPGSAVQRWPTPPLQQAVSGNGSSASGDSSNGATVTGAVLVELQLQVTLGVASGAVTLVVKPDPCDPSSLPLFLDIPTDGAWPQVTAATPSLVAADAVVGMGGILGNSQWDGFCVAVSAMPCKARPATQFSAYLVIAAAVSPLPFPCPAHLHAWKPSPCRIVH